MLYTFNILAEQIIRDLSNGPIPADSPYDPAYVKNHIRNAMEENLKMEILKKRTGDEDDRSPVTQCIFTYTRSVLYDTPTNRAYAELPSYFQALKYNKGIHSVSKLKDSIHPMIPMNNHMVSSFLPHGDLERLNWGYYVEGMRVFCEALV